MKANQPKGDIWMLKDTDVESQYYGTVFKFTFSCISSEDIKQVVKDYIWMDYRTGNRRLKGLYSSFFTIFKYLNAFFESRNITRLADLTNVDISNFLSYMHTTLSDKTKKPLSYATQKKVLDGLKSLIYWCQLHKPDKAPEKEIFTGNEYRGVNSKLKIEFIPDDVIEKINEALKTEENPYIRYGIIIFESTGIRRGDLLRLTTDCIKTHPISGYTIQWFDHKNLRQREPMPVRSECAMAIESLAEVTKELREQADNSIKDYLFIHRVKTGKQAKKIVLMNYDLIGRWLDEFIMRNNILDSAGNPYNLTSHQFRRTLGTDMLSKGTNITVIQQVLGHADPSTTKLFYSDVKDKDRAEIFKQIGIIGNINQVDASVIDNPVELEWFKANKDMGACMCDGYCTKPFIDGQLCDRLLKRRKCYTCSRYITTPEYLEAHRNHLKVLETQLENNIYGEHYAEHFKPTIEVLKVIISRLEELQDGCN